MMLINSFRKMLDKGVQRPFVFASVLGALFTLGFAPFYVWPLAVLALSGLIYVSKRMLSVKQAAFVGFLFGLVHHVTALHWVTGSFLVTVEPEWLAYVAGGASVVGISTYLALYIAFVCAVHKRFSKRFFAPLLFVILWLGAEWLRSYLPEAFAWNLSGYMLVGDTYLLQMASVGTIWLMGAFVVSVAAFLVAPRYWKVLPVILIVLAYGFGVNRLSDRPVADILKPEPDAYKIRLVQGDVPQKEKWQKELKWDHLDEYLYFTSKQVDNRKPDIIIWPETAVADYAYNKRFIHEQLLNSIDESQRLIVGTPRYQKYMDGDYKVYNSLVVMGGLSRKFSIYDKKLLVPFGEYIPMRDYLPEILKGFVQGQADYVSGVNSRKLLAKGLSFYPLICGESVTPIYSEVGESYILNVTNDAWFEGTIGPDQHYAKAKVRAVESGKTLVRVANKGVTSVLDGYGRELLRMPDDVFAAVDVYLK